MITDARTGSLEWDAVGDDSDRGLVMIHSLGANRRMWDDQTERLSRERHLVMGNLPGHGGSSAHSGDYSIGDLGNDFADIASEAGLETFDVCGISLGGVVALWMAINLPDRVTRLVACNTGAKIGTAEAWNERIERVLAGGMESLRDAVVPRFITEDLEERRPDAHRKVYEMFDSIDPVGYAGCSAALRDADLRDALGEISCPTLLVGGSEDVATPPEQTYGLQKAISGSNSVIIDHAAHLSNIDQPDSFNSAVGEFLS